MLSGRLYIFGIACSGYAVDTQKSTSYMILMWIFLWFCYWDLCFHSILCLQAGIVAESGSRGRSLAQRLPALGVDYGQTADNLPPPSAVAKLVQSTSISKLRLYGADPAILQAFANTGIGLVVGIGNDQIPSLNQLAVAQNWIKNNIVPFVPATDIIGISVGNEVLFSGDGTLISQLLPALQNLHTALVEVSLDQQIKVSTPHSMAILSTSAPPHLLAASMKVLT